MSHTYEDISKMIDHSLLQPFLTTEAMESGCRLARAYNVGSVCILPYYLKRCADILAGSTVQPSTTIGFPHGGHTTVIKQAEAVQAVADGCQELDMVVNISQVLSGQWDYVKTDIAAVIEVAAVCVRTKPTTCRARAGPAPGTRRCRICNSRPASGNPTQ